MRSSSLSKNLRVIIPGVLPILFGLGVVLVESHTALAACAPPNSTTPVGACPPAPSLAPVQGASATALDISNLFWIILGLSVLVFIPVMGALIISIVRFSHRPGDDEEPKQVYGNRRVEIAWTALPAGILLVTFILTVIVMNQVDAPVNAANALKVEAIGHQWWWEFRIPSEHIVTANEFHIPDNRLVEIQATSADVIHSFAVPQLTRQIDANPNIKTYVYISQARRGVYPGACYEFCGQGHAWMQFRVTVDSPAAFQAWAKSQAAPPAAPTTALAQQGESLFFGQSCGACHTINGTPANGIAAPNLTHVGSRWAIAGGVLVMSEQNLERWIANPQQWKEGALMPSFASLPENQLHALAAYLIGLK